MKKVKIEIELYEYDELNEKAKEKAFEEHQDFLSEIVEDWKNILLLNGEEFKSYIDDSIKANAYLFFENGEMANTTTYTDNHEKAGTRELNFHGVFYKIH